MSEAKANARRTKVSGRRGIYYRDTPQGRKYEVSYLDSDGRRRWQTVAGRDNLKEAETLLRAVGSKLDRGERVAPSRRTFADLADEWKAQLTVGDRTRELYDANLRLHLLPRFGRRRAQDVTVDDVARLIRDLQAKGLGGWSVRNVLTTLSSLMSWAVRRGAVPINPVSLLQGKERPAVDGRRHRIFERDEMAALLEAANPKYRVLLTTALFSGLRLMELLGLRWTDIDFEGGYIRVRKQLGRDGRLAAPKSKAGVRDVVLFAELARELRRHKAASRFSQEHDYVFASTTGRPLNWRNVETRGFDDAATAAGLAKVAKPVLHDCRHTFASLLIAQGLDVVFISRQLGHSDPSTTLRVYADLFDKARHADAMREKLSARFGSLFGNPMETASRNQAQDERPEVAQLRGIATGRS